MDIRLSQYFSSLFPARLPAETRVLRTTIHTDDGVRLDAAHLDSRLDRGVAIIVVHGFAGGRRLPAIRRVTAQMSRFGGVFSFDLRGHGRSAGISTLGDLEVADLAAVVAYARSVGYRSVAAVGFSMGGSIALRYAAQGYATLGYAAPGAGLCAVVSVSSPEQWNYRGTRAARMVQWCIHQPLGRLATRLFLGTRVSPQEWEDMPLSPVQAAERILIPLLIVHGDADPFLPVDHAGRLFAAANEPKELWIEKGMRHAETNVSAELLARMGRWITLACDQASSET